MPAKAYACKHCQRAFGNNKHAYSIHAKSGCPEKPGKQKTEEVPVLLLPPPIEDIVEVESVNLNAIESEEVEESDELERDHDYVSFGKKICNGRRTNYPTMTPELAQIAARPLEDLSQL